MRPVTIVGRPQGDAASMARWFEQALRQLELASNQADVAQTANNFTITGAYTATRSLDVTAATLAQLRAYVATLVSDLQKGGANRTT